MLVGSMMQAQSDSTAAKKYFSVGGNADLNYRYAMNKTPSSTSPTYDHARIGLGWINLLTEANFEHWGAALELGAGERASQLYYAEGAHYSHLIQGYVYANMGENLRASIGTFTTPFNYEYTEPSSNGNYTNTFIYTVIAASYSGLKLDYTLNDNWSVMAALFGDSDRRKLKGSSPHFSAQLNYGGETTNNSIDFVMGKDGDSTQVMMVDCFGDHRFTDRFLLGWQLHLMTDNDEVYGKSKWWGIALYFQEQFSSRFSLNLRSEWYDDSDGYWFGATNLHIFSNTLTGKFVLHPFILMPEIRLDNSSSPVFEQKNGSFGKQELSYLLGASVVF